MYKRNEFFYFQGIDDDLYPQHHPGSLTLGLGGIFIFFGIKSFPGSQAENKQIETEKTPQLFGFFFRLKSHFQPQEKQENGCLLYFFFALSGDKYDLFQFFSGYLNYWRTLLSLHYWLLLKWFNFVQK